MIVFYLIVICIFNGSEAIIKVCSVLFCSGNNCAYGLITSFKTGFDTSNNFKNTKCVYLC